MASKRGLTIALLAFALACAGMLARETWRQRQTALYNAAHARGDWLGTSTYSTPYRGFAAAFALQHSGELQEALRSYSKLQQSGDPRLRQAVQFNMANAYMRQALAVDREREGDLVLPLAELAKQAYRELLRADPGHWDGKHNLELALALFPDPEQKPLQEWQAAERGPRAIVSMKVDKELP